MRPCLIRRTCLTASLRPRRLDSRHYLFRRAFTSTKNAADEKDSSASHRQHVSERFPFPVHDARKDPTAWAAIVEHGLPPHLRQDKESQFSVTLDAVDLAEILVAAHRLTVFDDSVDILFHLGYEKNRWRSVVWIVKALVDAFRPQLSSPARLSRTLCPWKSDECLDEITRDESKVQRLATSGPNASLSPASFQSLDELTDDFKPENLAPEKLIWRDALASIWRSIGKMTIACVDGEIRPEILEIIAYLHHMEIMPISIYNQRPSLDSTAIQQPPWLNLLSSRILTSLSDAAWRAHEKLIVEEAKAKGREHVPLRPEIPGSAYRVRVAGLRPEVWLELILWSCLHGGWILEGAAILRTIFWDSRRQWRALSWRSLVDNKEQNQDWNKLAYLYNTQKSPWQEVSRPNSVPPDSLSVRGTVSSEVVNAYVDALLSTVRMGVGERGASPKFVLQHLLIFRKFLDRSDLGLGAGSWTAVVVRFFDAYEAIIDQSEKLNRLIGLTPSLGEELKSQNVQSSPAYVLDGSAAVLGLLHRALRSEIDKGHINAALRLFESLQELADKNKRKSIVDFLRRQPFLENDMNDSASSMFTTNYSGIEYPAFDVQIPPTILGPFMELILDAKAYDFGKWLLYSKDIDGPVLPERHYTDPAVTPSLVRFAAETNDTELLSKLVKAQSTQESDDGTQLPTNVLQSFFESQVNLRRWDAAVRMLQYAKKTYYFYWNYISMAHVIRVMLLHVRDAEAGDQKSIEHVDRAKKILSDMVNGRYERDGERSPESQGRIILLLTMLSTVSEEWAQYCLALRPLSGWYNMTLSAKAFNLVLEGVVETYGSVQGRRILGLFWSHEVRRGQIAGKRRSRGAAGELLMSKTIPNVLDKPERKRTTISIPGRPDQRVGILGGLRPDLMTVKIVLRKALEELKETASSAESNDASGSPLQVPGSDAHPFAEKQAKDEIDLSPLGMVVWGARCLRSLGMDDEDIQQELGTSLHEREVDKIRQEIPEIFEKVDDDPTDTRGLSTEPYRPFESESSS